MTIEKIVNALIVGHSSCTSKISDGYHSFGELYDHRIELYLALCRVVSDANNNYIWMSKKHSDGQEFVGWFVLGIDSDKGKQITYHIPNSRWKECARIFDVLERAPEFDGHTAEDVLKRLKIF